MMQTPILVPVDFSSCASDALSLAADIAGGQGAPLVILHVVHGAVAERGEYCAENGNGNHSSTPQMDLARARLNAYIDAQSERDPDLARLGDVRTALVQGVPATRILEVAHREGAGMIIMGSHGRSGLARLVTGSVAEAVVRQSDMPVTVVKETRHDDLHETAA